MKDRAGWGVAGWTAGVLVVLVALPWAASGRLPRRLATHWPAGSGGPDGSMPLWAAAAVPAGVWVLLVGGVVLGRRLAGPGGWVAGTLGGAGAGLAGGQAAIVRANLDRADWRQAGPMTGWAVGVAVAAVLIALGGALAGRRDAAQPVPDGPVLRIPDGERLVWLSRESNPWLRLAGAACGLVAVGAALAVLAGLTGPAWAVALPAGFASLALLGCSSVRARVTVRGLEVALGPLGLPVRSWPVRAIESARAEHRTPAQAGGWGYRINGLGTTVMLRGGECLVIRAKGRDFAVSVPDAARGAALLNTLAARRTASSAVASAAHPRTGAPAAALFVRGAARAWRRVFGQERE
ncbi:DUF1648 domain-containing protein [Streptomyces sp. NPDC048551]|uniref:DUF1648 domain-containing protein n=1 Tax=Streptomyces sp. NPDC048551 TaxID=3155758 RepID=UPI0034303A20